MDDSILTIIFYVGIIVVISISKYLSKSLKGKVEQSALFSESDEDSIDSVITDNSENYDYFRDRNLENNHLVSSLASSNILEEGVSAFTPINNSNKEIAQTEFSGETEMPFPYLANFDARAAIIYSEILKRPEY